MAGTAIERSGVWPGRALVALVLGLTALRLAVAAGAGPSDDEAYYRLWSLAPAWGYLDHPPMVAWWMAAGRWLAGDTLLGLRLLAPLALLAGSWPLWRTARLLHGPRVAARALLFFHLLPLIAVGGVVMTPDVPAVFFWGLALWTLAEYAAGRDARWFLATGLCCGLGLLSKYALAGFGAGLLLWLATLPALRPAFRAAWLWLGGLLALLLFLPVVLWNAAHGQASFALQLGRLVRWEGLEARFLAEFLGGQLLLLGPLLLPFLALGAAAAWRGWRRGDGLAALPLVTSLPLAAVLLLHALHERVLGQWPAPLYPAAALLAALGVERLPALAPTARRWLRPLARAVAPAGLAVALLLYGYAALPLGPLPLREPTWQMRGWPPLAEAVAGAAGAAGAAWIATPTYALTGQLSLALPAGPPVLQLNQRLRYASLPPPEPALLRRPALFVTEAGRDYGWLLRPLFAERRLLGTLERMEGGVTLATYEVWRLDGFAADRLP